MDFNLKYYLFILSLMFSITCFSQVPIEDQFILIGNETSLKKITKKELSKIFKAKFTRWKNGKKVTIVLPNPETENAKIISEKIYNTSVKGLQKFWLSQVFQGRVSPPVFLDSDKEIINYIKNNPGAIALIRRGNNVNINIIIEIE